MRTAAIMLAILLAGCGSSGSDYTEEQHEGLVLRHIQGAEQHITADEAYAIWLDTEACVTGTSGALVPPVVEVQPVDRLVSGGRTVAGIARRSENLVILPQSSLRPKQLPPGWVDYSIIRHEFVHLIAPAIGIESDDNHDHRWGREVWACIF